MKKTPKLLFLAAAALSLISSIAVNSQNPSSTNTDWIRVQSDDGEFSIEVPPTYKFFYDNDGFSVGGSIREFSLRNMEMLNSYVDGTLLSFERYAGDHDAAAVMFESDSKSRGVTASSVETRPSGLKYRQIVSKTDQMYAVRQYFYTKGHIYVLTAASRGEETVAMRRFLDSVNIMMKPPATIRPDAIVLSKLTPSRLNIEDETNNSKASSVRKDQQPPKPGPADKPLVIVNKPLASYTGAARRALTTGTIAVRVDFDADASVTRIAFIKMLSNGLSRQTLMAALRIKFIPAEKDGTPEKSSKLVEYTFSIY